MQNYQSAFRVQNEDHLFNSDHEEEIINKQKDPIQLKFYQRSKLIIQENERLQKKIEKQIHDQVNSSKISQNSCKLLTQKIERQLQTILNEKSDYLSFEQVGRILQELQIFRLIQYDDQYKIMNKEKFNNFSQQEKLRLNQEMVFHEELWVLLQVSAQDEQIQIERLYTILRLLLDPNKLNNAQLAKLLNKFYKDQEQWTIEEFIINFKILVQDRQYSQPIHQLKDKKKEEYIQKNQKENTHKPQLNKTTNNIIQKIEQDLFLNNNDKYKSKFEKRLIYYRQKEMVKQTKAKDRKSQQIIEEEENCSFQPQINKSQNSKLERSKSQIDRLYTIEPFIRKQEQTNKAQIQKEEQELKQCTFKPQINDRIKIPNTNQPKGFDDTVKRMREAIVKNQQNRDLKEKIPRGENYHKLKRVQRPFSFHERETTKKEPILQINVKVSQNKTAKITINEGENPLKIVTKFSQMFQLSNQQEQNLLEIIQNNLK